MENQLLVLNVETVEAPLIARQVSDVYKVSVEMQRATYA